MFAEDLQGDVYNSSPAISVLFLVSHSGSPDRPPPRPLGLFQAGSLATAIPGMVTLGFSQIAQAGELEERVGSCGGKTHKTELLERRVGIFQKEKHARRQSIGSDWTRASFGGTRRPPPRD